MPLMIRSPVKNLLVSFLKIAHTIFDIECSILSCRWRISGRGKRLDILKSALPRRSGNSERSPISLPCKINSGLESRLQISLAGCGVWE